MNVSEHKPQPASASTPSLRLPQMAGWGLADMGINIFVIVKQMALLAFMTQFLGVPIWIAGLITSSVLVFDIITDPLVGWLSDRTQTRWGRRLPFMAVGAPLLSLLLLFLFAVPSAFTGIQAAIWVGVFFALSSVAWTLIVIPFGAMSSELTSDPKQRSTLIAFRMASASLGLLLAGGIFPILVGGTREGYFTAALVLFVPVILVSVGICILATRNAPKATSVSTDGLWTQVAAAWENKAFCLLVLIYGVQTLGIAIITAGIPFAAWYLITDSGTSFVSGLGMPPETIMFAFFVLGSMISQYFWAKLSHAVGKPRAFAVGSMLYVVALVAFFNLLPTQSMGLVAIFSLLIGFCNGCYQQLPWAMLPDLIDRTTQASGKAYEGAFNAFWLLGQKVANAIGPGFLGLLLAAYGWNEATGATVAQPTAAVEALRWAMTLVPAILLLISLLIYFTLKRRT